MALRLLIIDDDEPVLRALSKFFSGHEVHTSSDPIAGLERALNEDFDGILIDMRMPRMGGPEVATKLIAARPETGSKVVLLTGGDATDHTGLPAPVVWKPLSRDEVDRLVWWWEGQVDSG